MRSFIFILALAISPLCAADTIVNRQFHSTSDEGITIVNRGLLPRTIFARFLIPGLAEDARRNTGTKYTINPQSEITYYLPAGTEVVATDGIYWDNPYPNFPDERAILTVTRGKILRVSSDAFNFSP